MLGYSPPGGDIPGNIAPPPSERGANLLGGGESPVTTAWANSSTFLKILSCPPKYEFAPQMPPQILRPGAATDIQVGGLERRRKKCVAANTDYGVAWPQIGWKSRNSLDFR